MSYARFGWDGSDVYIYEHVGGFIECCGCSLTKPEDPHEIFGFYHANTAREMLSHIDEHLAAGDTVPTDCIERIKQEHSDLDAQIQPYVEDPVRHAEKKARLLKKMREAIMDSPKEEETE